MIIHYLLTGIPVSYTHLEDFPQFTRKVTTEEGEELEVQNLLPDGILNMFLDQVNDSVLPVSYTHLFWKTMLPGIMDQTW